MSMLATATTQNAKRAQKEQQRELINIYARSRARMLNKISPTGAEKGEDGPFLADTSSPQSLEEQIQQLLFAIDLLSLVEHTADCYWRVLEYHGTANGEWWREMMMAGFDLAQETFLWWGVWVLECSHFEADTRTLLGYDMRR